MSCSLGAGFVGLDEAIAVSFVQRPDLKALQMKVIIEYGTKLLWRPLSDMRYEP
jgi:hypothetical protein